MRKFIFILIAYALLFNNVYASELFVKKNEYIIPGFKTTAGASIKNVRIGWESYGTLNEDRDNVILIEHFFSGNSHAAGKYRDSDAQSGYWDALIGPNKLFDTNKYFIISSDSLSNFSAKSPDVITTGPASINPDTGKQYGMSFPILSIRDFVNAQKYLLDSLNVKSIHAVVGTSFGALQALEWGVAYPHYTKRIISSIGGVESDPFLIELLNFWSLPIKLDPNWNNGNYYGGLEPSIGVTESLKMAILHSRHWKWADTSFARSWANNNLDPSMSINNLYSIERSLNDTASTWSKFGDANSFLYLVKAWQNFTLGNSDSWYQSVNHIESSVLWIASSDDLLYPKERFMSMHFNSLSQSLRNFEYTDIVSSSSGHFDGLGHIDKASEIIQIFLSK